MADPENAQRLGPVERPYIEAAARMTPFDVLTWLEGQVQRPTRAAVALYYRDLLIEYWHDPMAVDWKPLNLAIMNRWSDSGLQWIKAHAWRAATAEMARRA